MKLTRSLFTALWPRLSLPHRLRLWGTSGIKCGDSECGEAPRKPRWRRPESFLHLLSSHMCPYVNTQTGIMGNHTLHMTQTIITVYFLCRSKSLTFGLSVFTWPWWWGGWFWPRATKTRWTTEITMATSVLSWRDRYVFMHPSHWQLEQDPI